jgi:hypothetical protein
MWYKQQPDGTWIRANRVEIPNVPDNIVLEFNHNAKIQGWEWFEEPPQAYTDWLDALRNEF